MEQQKSFRVHTTLLASMCHTMLFSARALKKNIFFDVDIVVKNKSKCGLSWSVLLPTMEYVSLLVSQTVFRIVLCVFSCQDKYLFRYLWYCGKKQIECGLACVLLSTTIRIITVVKMLCKKLSYITKRALCFSYWVRQQHTPMGK